MLFYLIYTSKAVKLMQENDLQQILAESKAWNQTHGITGMRLYIEGQFFTQRGGRFMQVLEGTEAEVKRIFNKIKQDSRHHHVMQLNESRIEERNFETWAMGFKSLELDKLQQLPEFFELDENFLKSQNIHKFNMPLTLLKSFYGQYQGSKKS